jgi:predicted  nucleic acid-binding Zn-ribbon protein
MHKDIATALRLQSLDVRIADLRREIATLPKQIAQIERALDAHNKRLEADKAALAANQRDRKKLDADVQAHHQKISKLRDQMLGAKTNDQYRAFQNEIEFCEQAIRKCDDLSLEQMSAAEALEKNVKIAEAALATERKTVDAEKQRAKACADADKAELAKALALRAEEAKSMPAPLMTMYERLRTRYYKDGDTIAEARDGKCMTCMITLRPQFFQEVKAGEVVKFCENCRRILYHPDAATDVAANMDL